MKNLLILAFVLIVFSVKAQTTLVSWNFSDSNNTADGGISANLAQTITTTSTGTVSYPTTTSGTCTQPYILNTGWNSGDAYWQFSFTSTNYSSISLGFSSRSSSTGPSAFKVQYSTGGVYTDVASSSFDHSAATTCASRGAFSLPSDVDNKASVTIRIINTSTVSQNGGTTASTGTSGIDNIIVSATTFLPVQLHRFSIESSFNTTLLTFTTASERNNSHFEIERSLDGRDFVQIGEVKGAGTTTEEQNYTFVDETPAKAINYYRLKQVDFDGAYEYSKVVSVNMGGRSEMKVIPTVVVDQINVGIEASAENGTWDIFDASGRAVLSGTIEAEQDHFQADMTGLQNGAYVVRVQLNGEVITERIMKI